MVASCFGGVSVTVRVRRIFHRVEMKRDQFLNKPPCWSGLKSRCRRAVSGVWSIRWGVFARPLEGFAPLSTLLLGVCVDMLLPSSQTNPFVLIILSCSYLFFAHLSWDLYPFLNSSRSFVSKMELHCPPETATTPSVTAGCGQVFGPLGSSWPHLSFDVSLVHRATVHHCCTGCGGNTSSTGQTSC